MALKHIKHLVKRLKIRTKLILLMILIAYASVIVVGYFSYQVGRGIIDDQINQTLSVQTQTTLETANKLIYDRFNDLQILIGESTLASPKATSEEKTRVLRSSLVNLGWYDELYLTNNQGVVIASTLKSAIDQDVSESSWYQNAGNDFVSVSDVIESGFTGKETLVFANTVQDEAKNVLGSLVAELPMSIVDDLLKRLPEETEAYLIASSGKTLAFKGPEQESNASIDTEGNYVLVDSYLQQQIESEGYFSFDGNGWKLALQTPKSLAYAPINRFALLLLIILGVIILPVGLYGHFSSKRFVRPILALANVMGKVRQGDLNQEIQVESEDEIGYLSSTFNHMTKDLLEKTNNLVEEKGKYKSILESTNEGLVLFNTSNQLITINHGFEKLFPKAKNLKDGAKATDVLSFLNKKNVNDESKKNLDKILPILTEKDFKKDVTVEITLVQPYHILLLYTKPVQDENGQLLGRIWVFNDITEEVESERSKSEFVKVASHKLRTPVTSLNWSTQMLLDGSLGKISDDQREVIQQLKDGGERLSALSALLINTAEIKNDKLGLKRDVFSLSELMRKVKNNMDNSVQNKPLVTLSMEVDPYEKINVKGDIDKLELLFNSLLDNSFVYSKAEKKNHVKVDVKVDKKEEQVIISVSDEGIGIPKEDHAKVFTKFFRGKEAYLIHTEGTGLSLFLAEVIQRSDHQKIWFDEAKKDGATFYFTIKLVDKK